MLHVCTPNDVHAEQALAALERGVHVVCEKPLAVSTGESARLVAAAAEQGLVGATCYHVRGYPLVEQMRAEAQPGRSGEITFVHGRYLCDDVLFPASGWRLDPARSGPSYVVGDLGTHWLDLAEHVTGLQVAEVLAEFRSFAGGPLEDYAAPAAAVRRRRARARSSSRPGAAGRKNQLLFECEGSDAGLTWDQEVPTRCCSAELTGPTQIVVKDPVTNAASARRLSRYPAGHGEGYGDAFRNLFAQRLPGDCGRAARAVPDLRRRPPRRRTVEAAVASARTAAGRRSPR